MICFYCGFWVPLVNGDFAFDPNFQTGLLQKGKCIWCPPVPLGDFRGELSAWSYTLAGDNCNLCSCRSCARGWQGDFPVCVAIVTPSFYSGLGPKSISLIGYNSYDPNGKEIISYLWDCDEDGEFDDAIGDDTSYVFTETFIGKIWLRITNSDNVTSECYQDVYIEILEPEP